MIAIALARRVRRNGFALLAAALMVAGLTALHPDPAMAMKSRFSKAELCQVLYPCEPPARYQSGPYLEKPRIVSVSMQQVQAICAGHSDMAAGSGFPFTVMGCAQLTGTECVVHVSDSLKKVSGDLYKLVLAHELGHCRGWRHN